MKKGFRILLSVIVVSGVAFAGFWLFQAHTLNQRVKEALSSYDMFGVDIEYEALVNRGFPFQIQVQLERPRLKVPAGLRKSLTYASEGNVVATFSLHGELESIDVHGLGQLYFSGKQAKKWQIESDGHLSFAPDGCALDLRDIKIAKAEVPYSHIDELKVAIQRTMPSSDRQLITLNFVMNGLEKITKPVSEDLKTSEGMLVKLSDLFTLKKGKTNNSFTLKADLPSAEAIHKLESFSALLFQESWPYATIDLETFHSKDNLTSSSGDLHIKFGQEGDTLLGLSVTSGGSLQFSANLYTALVDVLAALDVAVDLKPLIPRFEEFGTILSKMKTSFEVNKSLLLSLAGIEGTWRISDLEIASDLYGVKIGGEITNLNQPFTVRCSIDLLHYRRLLDDLVSYYNRVYSLVNTLQLANVPLLKPLSQEMETKILAYLAEIAKQPPQEATLPISLTYRDGAWQVGALTEEAFREKTRQLWSEIVADIAPSVSQEPEVPTTK